MGIVLGPNQYGKAEVRVVAIDRTTPRHGIKDLNVSTTLRGDFAAAHLDGDNGHVLATDTQKNTVFAFARDGIGEIEDFGLRLARHFAGAYRWITGARIEVEEYGWDRIPVGGREHDHAFTRAGGEVRTAVVTVDSGQEYVLSGLSGLVVLKTTDSAFAGFPRDRYTTLAETDDRILATAVSARWRHTGTVDWAGSFAGIRADLVETFATEPSEALQQTLYQMGSAVLSGRPELAEIRLSMPNKHHFLQDLSPFGLDNPKVVYHADDRPYGLIQAVVQRDDAPPAGTAWEGTPQYG
ncbi:MAG TPA: urate oxidase [Mycobacteriales bacterium]|nr:urate oxidase [Mycobacteriales bacterium]